MNDWKFLENGTAFHVPCESAAFRTKDRKSIKCNKCRTLLPKELELPAKVFGAFLKIDFQTLIEESINESMEQFEKKYYYGYYDK